MIRSPGFFDLIEFFRCKAGLCDDIAALQGKAVIERAAIADADPTSAWHPASAPETEPFLVMMYPMAEALISVSIEALDILSLASLTFPLACLFNLLLSFSFRYLSQSFGETLVPFS